jgi:hypothetical protein
MTDEGETIVDIGSSIMGRPGHRVIENLACPIALDGPINSIAIATLTATLPFDDPMA